MKIENYFTKKKEFEKMCKTRDMWSWGLEPHTAEEIMLAEIVSQEGKYDSPLVCASYYCKASDLTEKDIDNLLYINSGLFTYDGWDDDVVEFVVDLLQRGFKCNVYKELIDVVEKKKFNPYFRKKCKELCDKTVDLKLLTIKNRKDSVNGLIFQMYKGTQTIAENEKVSKRDIKPKTVLNLYDDLTKEVERLREDIEKFDEYEIRLSERLDWLALITRGTLPKEYIERRKPLWEEEKNIHR